MHDPASATASAPSPAVPAPKIEAIGLTKSFGTGEGAVPALGPLDLAIAEGEFVSLVGPSGCGKSTFVKLAAGLVEPTEGVMRVRVADPARPAIATVFQDYGIFPWMTVEKNILFALSTRGVGRAEARERAYDWLTRLGLRDFARSYPGMLSGGMRQRVAIARALATDPEILLMDEPFAALDAQMREMLQSELLELAQASHRTVVFVTHSLEEALVLSDRVIVMTSRPGTVLDEQIVPFERPRTADVRESSAFADMRGALWRHLRDEVVAQMERQGSVAMGGGR